MGQRAFTLRCDQTSSCTISDQCHKKRPNQIRSGIVLRIGLRDRVSWMLALHMLFPVQQYMDGGLSADSACFAQLMRRHAGCESPVKDSE